MKSKIIETHRVSANAGIERGREVNMMHLCAQLVHETKMTMKRLFNRIIGLTILLTILNVGCLLAGFYFKEFQIFNLAVFLEIELLILILYSVITISSRVFKRFERSFRKLDRFQQNLFLRIDSESEQIKRDTRESKLRILQEQKIIQENIENNHGVINTNLNQLSDEFYKSHASKDKPKLGVAGFYGYGNYGDELFWDVFVEHLSDIVELERVYDKLEKPYFSMGVESHVAKFDGILIGGGDIVQPWNIDHRYFSK